MVNTGKNLGFYADPIEIGKDYQFGGYGNLGGAILCPDGQWLPWLPEGESQLNFGFDPQGCVSWGTLNAIEILLRKMYSITDNFSDRYLAKVSDTSKQGNSPNKVIEALRKLGTTKEKDWPITSDLTDWDKFYVSVTDDAQKKAKEFLGLFTINHEYVAATPTQLKNALKYSPVGIAVSAWTKNEQGLYYSPFPNNHWVTLVGYKDGEYWIVYDSYPESEGDFIKHLAWDYDFSQAKRYAVNIKDQTAQTVWYILLLHNLSQFFGKWWQLWRA